MIFLTVGTQLPFDRLVRAVDSYLESNRELEVFAQIADSDYQPVYMKFERFLEPGAFATHFASATHIIAHAGMGTIIQSLLLRKPVLIMPRKASLGEQRNDHQLATAKRFSTRAGVVVADDETAFSAAIQELLAAQCSQPISEHANEDLLKYVAQFVKGH